MGHVLPFGVEVTTTVLVLPSSSVKVIGAGVMVDNRDTVVVAFNVDVFPATDVVDSNVVDSLSVIVVVPATGVIVLPAS